MVFMCLVLHVSFGSNVVQRWVSLLWLVILWMSIGLYLFHSWFSVGAVCGCLVVCVSTWVHRWFRWGSVVCGSCGSYFVHFDVALWSALVQFGSIG